MTENTQVPGVAEAGAGSPEQDKREQDLVNWVVSSFESGTNARLKEVLQSLVVHMHRFLREVRLTDDEWWTAVRFLTDAGHITDDVRQEFILLSDVLGISMQVVAMNNKNFKNATEATVFGPFHVDNSPAIELGGDISNGASGTPCWVEGTVTTTTGDPIPGAHIEVWESDDNGLYDVQYDDGRVAGRAQLTADDQGRYRFWGNVPAQYPIPDDGPVGKMLSAAGRSPMRAAHLHFLVAAPGCRRLVTHIFPRGDSLLRGDTVFGVRDSLVKDFVAQPGGTPTPDGRDLAGRDWARVKFDIVLAPEGA